MIRQQTEASVSSALSSANSIRQDGDPAKTAIPRNSSFATCLLHPRSRGISFNVMLDRVTSPMKDASSDPSLLTRSFECALHDRRSSNQVRKFRRSPMSPGVADVALLTMRSTSVANAVAVFLGVIVLRCLFCDVLLGAGPSPITHNTVSYHQTENGSADEP